MEIKVLSSTEKQTKFNKPMKALEVFAENEKRKVNIFSSALDFANIKQGYTINGNMSKNGDYWEITFDGAEKPRGGASGGFKTAQIEKVMEVKRQDISKFQDNKELSIKIASTMRMAVDLAIAERSNGHESLDNTFQESIRRWREWIWLEWDKTGFEDMPPF